MQRLLDKNNPENTVVCVVMRVEEDNDTEYECVGVLMEEDEDMIRVAFNAKNDKVVDDLKINRSNIIGIQIIDPSTIKKY